MKKYKLLRDLQDLKAGAIFQESKSGRGYSERPPKESQFYQGLLIPREFVESSPVWFEEIRLASEELRKRISDLQRSSDGRWFHEGQEDFYELAETLLEKELDEDFIYEILSRAYQTVKNEYGD